MKNLKKCFIAAVAAALLSVSPLTAAPAQADEPSVVERVSNVLTGTGVLGAAGLEGRLFGTVAGVMSGATAAVCDFAPSHRVELRQQVYDATGGEARGVVIAVTCPGEAGYQQAVQNQITLPAQWLARQQLFREARVAPDGTIVLPNGDTYVPAPPAQD